MALFAELKRRNVFRVAAAYLVTSWLLIEVSATLEDTLHLPAWADSLLAMFLLLGFPVALFFSWAYEITPEGVRREKDLDLDRATRSETGRKLDRVIMVMMALALGYFGLDKFVLAPGSAPAEHAESAPGHAGPASPGMENASEPPQPGDLSIAVLPFVNMSSDPEQEYFSDGLTEELLNLLAKIDQLSVAARTSSFFYKDKLTEVPFREIGRQLDVAHLLEGSVRKSGNKIRITAQLIKADDGYHLWSETYDRTLDDVFAIQDEIAAAVTEQLRLKLLGEAPRANVIDTESWELTLQARYLFGRREEGDLQRALELFQRAVELDPDNAAAWVGQAPLYAWYFDPPQYERMREAAQKAVDLDPQNPEAWSRLAQSLGATGESARARAAWERAVEMGQDNGLILSQMAGQRGLEGDLEGAIEYQRRAVAADPLYLVNLGNLVAYLIMADQFEEARATTRRVLELFPGSTAAYKALAQIHLLQDQPEEALAYFEKSDYTSQRLSMDSNDRNYVLAMIHHSLGNVALSDAALAEFTGLHGAEFPHEVAAIHAWRGDHDLAFEWLDRALETYPDLPLQFSWNPFLNGLEADARWAELMERWPVAGQ